MADGNKLQLVYIASVGHSGSTLLDLLISSHPRFASVGEAKQIQRADAIPCTCGSKTVRDCGLWREVFERTAASAGTSNDALPALESDDNDEFRVVNEAFFYSLQEATGADYIVDSSKSLKRLARLKKIPSLEIHCILLTRDPRGVVYSHVKKGREWSKYALHHRLFYRKAHTKHEAWWDAYITYEDLATDPDTEVVRVLKPMVDVSGFRFSEHIGDAEKHNIGGNRMRFSVSKVQLDEAWRKGLPGWQQVLTKLICR